MKTKLLIVCLLMFKSSTVFCQNQFDMIGKNHSPESKSRNVGGSNVDMYNGKANTSIPLHVFKGRELNLPIDVNYNSDGVQVNELASNVG